MKGEIVSLSKIVQKANKSELLPEEEAVVKRVLAGKEKLYKFDSADEAIAHLNRKRKSKK